MSVLAGKNVLIIDAPDTASSELETQLKKHHATVLKAVCGEVTPDYLTSQKVQLIVVNHVHNGEACFILLQKLQSKELQEIPAFVSVPDNEKAIQRVLMSGAADFILPNEKTDSVLIKLKTILGQPDNLSGSNVFALPDDETFVTAQGKRVFIVEDDSLLRNLLHAKLEATKFPHEFATSGATAVEQIKSFKPQVIILDLMLPVKNGFEILEEIKQDAQLKAIPVIIFSNRDSEEDKKRVFTLGAERFYVKAMTDLSVLIEAVEDLTS